MLAGTFALATLALSSGSALSAPGSYRTEVLADAPAGYWRLGELAGTIAQDETANATAGTYLGGVTLGVGGAIAGDPNAAVRLDGSNDLVGMGDPPSGVLDFGTTDFTVEAWTKTAVNGERLIAGKQTSGPYWQITVTDDSGHVGGLRAKIHDGSTTLQGYSAGRVDDGAWHHVVVVFDRDTGISFFVDGSPSGTALGASPGTVSNSAPLQVGKVSGYSYFTGDIDDVAVYATALPPARIQAHRAAALTDTTPPSVTLTAPSNGSTTADTTPTFAGAAGTAAGDSSTVTVKVYGGPTTGGPLVQTRRDHGLGRLVQRGRNTGSRTRYVHGAGRAVRFGREHGPQHGEHVHGHSHRSGTTRRHADGTAERQHDSGHDPDVRGCRGHGGRRLEHGHGQGLWWTDHRRAARPDACDHGLGRLVQRGRNTGSRTRYVHGAGRAVRFGREHGPQRGDHVHGRRPGSRRCWRHRLLRRDRAGRGNRGPARHSPGSDGLHTRRQRVRRGDSRGVRRLLQPLLGAAQGADVPRASGTTTTRPPTPPPTTATSVRRPATPRRATTATTSARGTWSSSTPTATRSAAARPARHRSNG